MSKELHHLGVAELARRLDAKAVSSVEVTKHLLARVAAHQQLGAFLCTDEAAALAHEPHRVAFYLYDLASAFHAHWTRGRDMPHLRFIIQNDPETTKARLALVQGIVTVLASGLALLGVDAPEEMR